VASNLGDDHALSDSASSSSDTVDDPVRLLSQMARKKQMDGRHKQHKHIDARLSAVAFIVSLHSKAGKVDAAKCRKLAIPFGPLIGRLQAGESITLDDGRVIEPHMVVGR
jgi:ribonuclease BN (tRNA processing enzyme)